MTAQMKIVSDATQEQEIRRDLAACYRLAALYGWDDQVATHISARLPGERFLINPFGMMFEEITASSLVMIDIEGNILEPTNYPVNRAGFVIHSAVHQARPDAGCVMHLHTPDGAAVSATKEGLLPLNQTALIVHHDMAYHDFEGPANDLEERERLQADLGHHNVMLLRNHGTLTVGSNVAGAFFRMYSLEWACKAQVRTLSMGLELQMPTKAVQDKMGADIGSNGLDGFAHSVLWPAMLRKVERSCPGFDD